MRGFITHRYEITVSPSIIGETMSMQYDDDVTKSET
jgi:hypothetical protein